MADLMSVVLKVEKGCLFGKATSFFRREIDPN
jgi:hypothetical protein